MGPRPVLWVLVAVLAVTGSWCAFVDDDGGDDRGIDRPETVEQAQRIARAGLVGPDTMPAEWDQVGTAGTPEHGPRSEPIEALGAFALSTSECDALVESARTAAEAIESSRGYVGPGESLYGNRVYVYADNGEASRFYAVLSGDRMRDCFASSTAAAIRGRLQDVQSEVGIRDIEGGATAVPDDLTAGDALAAFAFTAPVAPPEDGERPARVEFVVVRVGATVTVHSFRWLDEVDTAMRREVVQTSAAHVADALRVGGP